MEKERKKAEKEAKFAAKKAKQHAEKAAGGAAPGDSSKKREKKVKEVETIEEEYVELTPPGQKKGKEIPFSLLFTCSG